MADGVLPTVEAWRELQREVRQLRQDTVNLRKNLAHVSTRRHEAVWMPNFGYFCQAGIGSMTVSSESETQQNVTSLTEYDDHGNGIDKDEFTLDSGIITATKTAMYWVGMIAGLISIPYVQNDSADFSLRLQFRANSGGAWGSAGLTLRDSAYHANTAIGAGGAGTAARTYNAFGGTPGMSVVEGYQFRVVTVGGMYSSWPTVTVQAATLHFSRANRAA